MNDIIHEAQILFTAPLVRAILAGTKTVTRRIIDTRRLRVRLPNRVTSDPIRAEEQLIARPGVYRANIAQLGAVSIHVNGRMLGVKPGEFDFVCPAPSLHGTLYPLIERVEAILRVTCRGCAV